jgi:hypothetical protein
MVFGLFIEVAHFENTMTNNPEILPCSKKKSQILQNDFFNLKLLNLN